jgi:hypothetical protein
LVHRLEHAATAHEIAKLGIAMRVESATGLMAFLKDHDVPARHRAIANEDYRASEGGNAAADESVRAHGGGGPFVMDQPLSGLPQPGADSETTHASFARSPLNSASRKLKFPVAMKNQGYRLAIMGLWDIMGPRRVSRYVLWSSEVLSVSVGAAPPSATSIEANLALRICNNHIS